MYKECKDDAERFCHAKPKWNDWSIDAENGLLILPCLYHHIHEQEEGDHKDQDNQVDNILLFSKAIIILKQLTFLQLNFKDKQGMRV